MSTEGINTYNETSLHAALKEHYAGPGAVMEVPVGGFIADLVQDGVLIEVQTGNFSAMRRKLESLLCEHCVRVVYPIAVQKWLVRMTPEGEILSRRKSPKRGRWEEVFGELVAFPALMHHENFSLVVVMVHEEEIRLIDGKKRKWGKDWKRTERRLVEVVGEHLFESPGDLLGTLPDILPSPFTTSDLAGGLCMPRRLGQKMAYCLREMGLIDVVGNKRNGLQYVIGGTDT